LNGILDCLTPLRRKLLHLRMQVSRLTLLGWGQVLPSFHPIQNALLLLRRTPAEVLQSLLIPLLLLRRKPSELRIILQRPSLLLRRHILVLA
jgi:hypothetical protein